MLKYLYNFSFHPNNFTFELNETCQFKLKLLIITDQSFSEVQIVLSSELSCGSSQVSEFTTRFCGLESLTIKTDKNQWISWIINRWIQKVRYKKVDHMTSKTLLGFNWFTLIVCDWSITFIFVSLQCHCTLCRDQTTVYRI